VPSALMRETRTCRLAVFGQVARRYSSQASRALRVTARGPARPGVGPGHQARVARRHRAHGWRHPGSPRRRRHDRRSPGWRPASGPRPARSPVLAAQNSSTRRARPIARAPAPVFRLAQLAHSSWFRNRWSIPAVIGTGDRLPAWVSTQSARRGARCTGTRCQGGDLPREQAGPAARPAPSSPRLSSRPRSPPAAAARRAWWLTGHRQCGIGGPGRHRARPPHARRRCRRARRARRGRARRPRRGETGRCQDR
jgi:hypothetical protein